MHPCCSTPKGIVRLPAGILALLEQLKAQGAGGASGGGAPAAAPAGPPALTASEDVLDCCTYLIGLCKEAAGACQAALLRLGLPNPVRSHTSHAPVAAQTGAAAAAGQGAAGQSGGGTQGAAGSAGGAAGAGKAGGMEEDAKAEEEAEARRKAAKARQVGNFGLRMGCRICCLMMRMQQR